MLFFLLLSIALTSANALSSSLSEPAERLPPGRTLAFNINSTTNNYVFHSDELPWEPAVAACRSAPGGQLFFPQSEDEAREIERVTGPIRSWCIWVAASLVRDEEYQTLDGRSIFDQYARWHFGQPNSSNGREKCILSCRDALLSLGNCDVSFSFVCKFPANEPTPAPTTSTLQPPPTHQLSEPGEKLPPGRTLAFNINSTTNNYVFHSDELTWESAVAACRSAPGGQLFFPQSEDEAREVEHVTGPIRTYCLWVAASLVRDKEYETLDGRSIFEQYVLWDLGQPNSYNGIEKCMLFCNDALLSLRDCDITFPFVCKLPADESTPAPTTSALPPPAHQLCGGECSCESSRQFGRLVAAELRALPAAARLRAMGAVLRALQQHAGQPQGVCPSDTVH